MYCYHCGYEINENAIEQKSSTRQKYIEEAPLDAEIKYVCPRCGHLIHHGAEQKEADRKSHLVHGESGYQVNISSKISPCCLIHRGIFL